LFIKKNDFAILYFGTRKEAEELIKRNPIKSIAEESGIKMPSFFGYIFKFSIPILIPVFILVSLIFL